VALDLSMMHTVLRYNLIGVAADILGYNAIINNNGFRNDGSRYEGRIINNTNREGA